MAGSSLICATGGSSSAGGAGAEVNKYDASEVSYSKGEERDGGRHGGVARGDLEQVIISDWL